MRRALSKALLSGLFLWHLEYCLELVLGLHLCSSVRITLGGAQGPVCVGGIESVWEAVSKAEP